MEEKRPTYLLFSLSFISSPVPYPKQAGMMTECVYKTSPPVHAQCVTPKFSSTEKKSLVPRRYAIAILHPAPAARSRQAWTGRDSEGRNLGWEAKKSRTLVLPLTRPSPNFFLQRQSCIREKNRPAAAVKEKGEFCVCVSLTFSCRPNDAQCQRELRA